MKDSIDFYFDENYGKLYEKSDNGKAEIFEYEDENGKITSQFLIREIPDRINGKTYFDIVTPYGYGGPIVIYANNKEALIENYERSFSDYCIQNSIVSEFVRFHPLVKNYEDFGKMYNAIYMRKTLITKLDEEDPVQNQFSKSARKNIRRALNAGVTYEVTVAPENIDSFKEVYYSTMDRNNASEYYYFDDGYFANVLKYYRENLIFVQAFYEGKTIAAGLYFIYNDIIHIHLSGTLSVYLNLSPAYILRYAVTLWGIQNGYKLIHHGGGTSNSEENSLYLFKRNFAKKYDVDFYVGKKIWNKEIYDRLCEIKGVDKDTDFFPAYRKQ